MRKYNFLFFSVTLLIISCSDGKVPNGIIDQTVMTSLLTDVHILDGRLYSITQNPDSLYKYGTGRYKALFKKFHTDSLQFNNSLKYYSAQPAALSAIYQQVLINLKKKTDSLQKIQFRHPNALPK